MIIQPDFLDHWKTQKLVNLLRDEKAPLYVIRVWSHCQTRRTEVLPSDAESVKAICRASCDAEILKNSLVASGFLELREQALVAHEFLRANAALFAAYENGNKGGRPRRKTQRKPSANPRDTRGIPVGTPRATHAEPIREEKSREEYPPLPPVGGSEGADWLFGKIREKLPDGAGVEAVRLGMRGLEASPDQLADAAVEINAMAGRLGNVTQVVSKVLGRMVSPPKNFAPGGRKVCVVRERDGEKMFVESAAIERLPDGSRPHVMVDGLPEFVEVV